MIRVTSVLPEQDFKLRLQFSNGEARRFDMAPYLQFPIYQRLQNPGFFALAHIDYGTVVWPDELDIAPETLYERSVPIELRELR